MIDLIHLGILATVILHLLAGVMVVRMYLRSQVKLHPRAEIALLLLCGFYGWLFLYRYLGRNKR
tara:strand:- start:117 stop:308 length:192 start_codon:yes stop_codon:yes gene_type:complete